MGQRRPADLAGRQAEQTPSREPGLDGLAGAPTGAAAADLSVPGRRGDTADLALTLGRGAGTLAGAGAGEAAAREEEERRGERLPLWERALYLGAGAAGPFAAGTGLRALRRAGGPGGRAGAPLLGLVGGRATGDGVARDGLASRLGPGLSPIVRRGDELTAGAGLPGTRLGQETPGTFAENAARQAEREGGAVPEEGVLGAPYSGQQIGGFAPAQQTARGGEQLVAPPLVVGPRGTEVTVPDAVQEAFDLARAQGGRNALPSQQTLEAILHQIVEVPEQLQTAGITDPARLLQQYRNGVAGGGQMLRWYQRMADSLAKVATVTRTVNGQRQQVVDGRLLEELLIGFGAGGQRTVPDVNYSIALAFPRARQMLQDAGQWDQFLKDARAARAAGGWTKPKGWLEQNMAPWMKQAGAEGHTLDVDGMLATYWLDGRTNIEGGTKLANYYTDTRDAGRAAFNFLTVPDSWEFRRHGVFDDPAKNRALSLAIQAMNSGHGPGRGGQPAAVPGRVVGGLPAGDGGHGPRPHRAARPGPAQPRLRPHQARRQGQPAPHLRDDGLPGPPREPENILLGNRPLAQMLQRDLKAGRLSGYTFPWEQGAGVLAPEGPAGLTHVPKYRSTVPEDIEATSTVNTPESRVRMRGVADAQARQAAVLTPLSPTDADAFLRANGWQPDSSLPPGLQGPGVPAGEGVFPALREAGVQHRVGLVAQPNGGTALTVTVAVENQEATEAIGAVLARAAGGQGVTVVRPTFRPDSSPDADTVIVLTDQGLRRRGVTPAQLPPHIKSADGTRYVLADWDGSRATAADPYGLAAIEQDLVALGFDPSPQPKVGDIYGALADVRRTPVPDDAARDALLAERLPSDDPFWSAGAMAFVDLGPPPLAPREAPSRREAGERPPPARRLRERPALEEQNRPGPQRRSRPPAAAGEAPPPSSIRTASPPSATSPAPQAAQAPLAPLEAVGRRARERLLGPAPSPAPSGEQASRVLAGGSRTRGRRSETGPPRGRGPAPAGPAPGADVWAGGCAALQRRGQPVHRGLRGQRQRPRLHRGPPQPHPDERRRPDARRPDHRRHRRLLGHHPPGRPRGDGGCDADVRAGAGRAGQQPGPLLPQRGGVPPGGLRPRLVRAAGQPPGPPGPQPPGGLRHPSAAVRAAQPAPRPAPAGAVRGLRAGRAGGHLGGRPGGAGQGGRPLRGAAPGRGLLGRGDQQPAELRHHGQPAGQLRHPPGRAQAGRAGLPRGHAAGRAGVPGPRRGRPHYPYGAAGRDYDLAERQIAQQALRAALALDQDDIAFAMPLFDRMVELDHHDLEQAMGSDALNSLLMDLERQSKLGYLTTTHQLTLLDEASAAYQRLRQSHDAMAGQRATRDARRTQAVSFDDRPVPQKPGEPMPEMSEAEIEATRRYEAEEAQESGGEIDPEEFEVSEEVGRAQGSIDRQTTVQNLRESLYTEDKTATITKELTQNSIDALDSAGLLHKKGGGKLRVDLYPTEKVITIEDNGVGMSPAVVKKAFIVVGKSHKPEITHPRGNFGFAKVAILGGSQDMKMVTQWKSKKDGKVWRTVMEGSAEDWMRQGYRIRSMEVTVPDEKWTGTKLYLKLHDQAKFPEGPAAAYLRDFARNMTLPVEFKLTQHDRNWGSGAPTTANDLTIVREQNGQPKLDKDGKVSPPGRPGRAPQEAHHAAALPGANGGVAGDADIYLSAEVSPQSQVNVAVLSNGLQQANFKVDVSGPEGQRPVMPVQVTVDIKNAVGAGDPDYAWTTSRDDLQTVTKQKITEYVQRELGDAARRAESAALRKAIMDAPRIGKTRMRWVNASGYPAEVVDFIQQGYTGTAGATALRPQGAVDNHQALANALRTGFAQVQASVVAMDPRNADSYKNSQFAGFGFSKAWMGINVPTQTFAPDTPYHIYANPHALLSTSERKVKERVRLGNLRDADGNRLYGDEDAVLLPRLSREFAQKLAWLLHHEITHQPERWHGNSFEQALADNIYADLDLQDRLVKRFRTLLERNDYELLQQLRAEQTALAAAESGLSDELFAKIGSQRPGGPGGPPAAPGPPAPPLPPDGEGGTDAPLPGRPPEGGPGGMAPPGEGGFSASYQPGKNALEGLEGDSLENGQGFLKQALEQYVRDGESERVLRTILGIMQDAGMDAQTEYEEATRFAGSGQTPPWESVNPGAAAGSGLLAALRADAAATGRAGAGAGVDGAATRPGATDGAGAAAGPRGAWPGRRAPGAAPTTGPGPGADAQPAGGPPGGGPGGQPGAPAAAGAGSPPASGPPVDPATAASPLNQHKGGLNAWAKLVQLFSPKGLLRQGLGAALGLAWQPVERTGAAALAVPMRITRGGRAGESPTFGEAGAMWGAYRPGRGNYKKAAAAVARGPSAQMRAAMGAPPGGSATGLDRVLEVGYNILGVFDNFARTMAFEAEAAAQRQRGRTGRPRTSGPRTPRRYRTLTQDLDLVGDRINKLRDIPGGDFVIPYWQVPYNGMKYDMERSAMGLAALPKAVGELRAGKIDATEYYERWTRALLGTGITVALFQLALGDDITGPEPESQTEKDAWRAENKKPFSIRVPGTGRWIPVGMIPGMNSSLTMASTAADFYKRQRLEGRPQDMDYFGRLANRSVTATIHALASRPFFDGVYNILEVLEKGDEAGEKGLLTGGADIAGGFLVPGVVRDLERAFDETERAPRDAWERVTSNLPVLSGQVPARRDAFGNVRKRTGSGLERFLNPMVGAQATDELGRRRYPGSKSAMEDTTVARAEEAVRREKASIASGFMPASEDRPTARQRTLAGRAEVAKETGSSVSEIWETRRRNERIRRNKEKAQQGRVNPVSAVARLVGAS